MADTMEAARCPYCAEEIRADARKCRHCGEWLNGRSERTAIVRGGREATSAPVVQRTDQSLRHRLRRGTKLRKTATAVVALMLLCVLLGGAILVFGLHRYTYSGDSMTPTIKSGQTVVTETLSYALGSPRRGDIVAFRASPAGLPNRIFIKRIIGLPGETVAIHGRAVYINGQRLNEPYIQPQDRATYTLPPMTVPPNAYFVLGDNRNNSEDSHIFGTVARKYIVGKVWFSW